jgi:hypothetical protein
VSAANVEVVRRPYELLNSRDVDGCADALARVEAGRITFATGYGTLAKALAAVDPDR